MQRPHAALTDSGGFRLSRSASVPPRRNAIRMPISSEVSIRAYALIAYRGAPSFIACRNSRQVRARDDGSAIHRGAFTAMSCPDGAW